MTQPDSTHDIQALDNVAAMLLRPAMYLGPLDEPAAVNTLLVEACCIAIDNAQFGCATEMTVTLHADGSASVRDNGPGLSVEVGSDGLTVIERMLTKTFACREAKKNTIINQCSVGIVVTNVFSEWLTVETVQDGWLWKQHYSRGYAASALEKQEPCAENGLHISFRPDREIFGAAELSPVYFAKWFKERNLPLGPARVTLWHSNNAIPLWP